MNNNFLKAGALVAAGGALTGCGQKQEAPRPNVVFILADDLGWGDLGCYGQRLIETPNIDALAGTGIRFTQCYSGTAVSAPSRSCLLTGTHSGHTAIRGNLPAKGRPGIPEGQQELPEGSRTIFHDFREAGYRTGAFGKWGLGYITTEGNPKAMGVDEFFGYNCQTLAHSYYPDHLWENDTKILLEDNVPEIPYGQGTYSGDLIHSKSLEFIEQAVADGKPFFMWYPTTIPHAELIVPEDEIIRKYRAKFPDETPWAGQDQGHPRFRIGGYGSCAEPHATFAAMVSRLDKYVGEIVDKLKELGVYDNTIILFASDNGPHQEGGADPDFFDSNGPWRGYKRDLYEGGVRVPMIVSWPGHVAAGTESDFMCTFWDMMPTFRTVLDHNAQVADMDGISLLPLLEGRSQDQAEHDFLYFEFAERNSQAARIGPWKLVRLGINSPADHYELYNLDEDPGEEHDVIADYPDKVEELKSVLVREHVPNHIFPLFAGE
ncbi:MAG: arylsulfatase [Bacteroidales bacterium]|nr:arylsulfatase [Bacteroidales bacterium]